MPTSGPELRRERRAAEITTVALAAQIGLSRASLYTLEVAAVVPPERVVAYREAIKALTAAKDTAA